MPRSSQKTLKMKQKYMFFDEFNWVRREVECWETNSTKVKKMRAISGLLERSV